MKLWVDDMRPAPNGYAYACSVNKAKHTIEYFEKYQNVNSLSRELIDGLIDDIYFIFVDIRLSK